MSIRRVEVFGAGSGRSPIACVVPSRAKNAMLIIRIKEIFVEKTNENELQ